MGSIDPFDLASQGLADTAFHSLAEVSPYERVSMGAVGRIWVGGLSGRHNE
jgi:hypothetical protein